MNYILHLVIFVEIFAILSLSLNLLVGLNGFLSLAHAAFYGLGAYVATLLILDGSNFFAAMIVASLVAAALSFMISSASLRFKGDIFILVTLAFQVVFYAIIYNWVSVTRGPYGIPGIPRPGILGSSLPEVALLYGVLGGLVILGMSVILSSPFALSIIAIREDFLAAQALGKKVFMLRAKSTALASGIAAIAGAMYASYVTFIDPTSFTIDESILLVAMVLVGGSGNLVGPIIGAVVLVLLPEALRLIDIPDSVGPNIRLIIYGLALVILMYVRPRGIAGVYRFE
jgi:branched-chain amino acid transport system permease protein